MEWLSGSTKAVLQQSLSPHIERWWKFVYLDNRHVCRLIKQTFIYELLNSVNQHKTFDFLQIYHRCKVNTILLYWLLEHICSVQVKSQNEREYRSVQKALLILFQVRLSFFVDFNLEPLRSCLQSSGSCRAITKESSRQAVMRQWIALL